MRNKTYTLNSLLAALMSIALLACILIRTLAPRIILPKPDIPNIVLLCLAALVLDYYLAPGARRCYLRISIFSAITFGLLPFAACFVGILDALKLALAGGILFPTVTWLYSSIQDRLSSGPAAKAAPVVSALGLYLSFQAFAGMFL